MRRRGISFPRPSYAVSVSLIAVMIGGGGSAIAAKKIRQYDSRHIKNNSIVNQHIQNFQLGESDFSAKTRTFLKTSEEQRGPQGRAGETGVQGEKGDRQYTYAYRDTGRLKNITADPPNADRCPDTNAYSWPGGVDPNDDEDPCMDWYAVPSSVELSSADLEQLTAASLDNQPRITLQTSDSNAGYVKFRVRSDFLVTANVTMWHRGSVHTRAECVVQTAKATSGTQLSSYTNAGAPIVVSSAKPNEVHSISLVGGSTADGSEVAPGEYAARVSCRAVDRVGNLANDWIFVKGNLSVIASKD